MLLSGKLAIGLLHEDNPIKSFFRMKPILTESADRWEKVDLTDRFPEEGYIRIVPDKNEISIFKNRMRQMGRYCALDLRKHFGESDKIRPNKNYIPGGLERNAYIVYSDVIGRLPAHLLAEVISVDEDLSNGTLQLRRDLPGTAYVVLRKNGELSGPWSWFADENDNALVTLTHAEEQPFSTHPDSLLEGQSLHVLMDEGDAALLLYDMSAFGLTEIPLPEIERPAMERTPAEAMPHSTSQMLDYTVGHLPRDAYRDPPFPAMSQGISSSGDGPWSSGRGFQEDRFRPSLREQALQAQVGLNPQRGASLHEVVDEGWRNARLAQLGHPVPVQATARPTASPIERADVSVQEAWALPEARLSLVDALLKNEDLRDALIKRLDIPLRASAQNIAMNETLNDMEASRLKVIGEIDALRIRRDEAKAALMEELKQAHHKELAEHEQRVDTLKAEIQRNQKAAMSAEKAAALAQSMLDEAKERLDERLMSSLLGTRACELMRRQKANPVKAALPETYEPSAGELISDIRIQMERAGFLLGNDETVNLLACMMAGTTVILSGSGGSGKSVLPRRFAAALGLCRDTGRFAETQTLDEGTVQRLLSQNDRLTPLVLFADDLNTEDCDRRMQKIVSLQEKIAEENLPLRLFLSVQDAPDGQGLSARLLSRSFFIRLRPTSPADPWCPSDARFPAPGRAVSLAALNKIFPLNADLAVQATERLQRLREGLSRLGWMMDRRMLNELWRYCSAAHALVQCSVTELLDMALTQRVVPALMASMGVARLREMPALLADMPRCLRLMEQPLPLPPR